MIGMQEDTPWWVLVMGGTAIVLGLAMWGYRVMATVGHNMTKLTSSRGFNIGTPTVTATAVQSVPYSCMAVQRCSMEVLRGFSDHMPNNAYPPSSTEFGAAMTVLIASRLSIPISTTHCVVGSVFAVGLADGIKAVNWRLFVNIVLSWVITLPITLGLAAATFALLDLFY